MKHYNEKLIPLFSTPVVVTNIGRDFTESELQLFFKDILIEKVEGEITQGTQRVMSNHGSKDRFLFDTLAEELKDIKKFCEHQLKNYLEEIEGADTNLAGLRITQSWLNKTKPQEFHHSHFHRNSYISAVLYICCLPNDHINFENPYRSYDNMLFPKKKTTEWNVSGVSVNVTEGDLIVFPSWVKHSVSMNETKNRERISLGVNTFPIGEMGKGTTYLKL